MFDLFMSLGDVAHLCVWEGNRSSVGKDKELKATLPVRRPAVPDDAFVRSRELCYANGSKWVGR